MKKRRIKKSVIKKGLIILAAIILVITITITLKTIKYHKTDEYKLKQIGYNKEEIKTLLNEPEENITYILNNEYNEDLTKILEQKYYISKNLERYINYKNENKDKELKDIIALVNTNRDKTEYEETNKTDIEKKELMLVNKYNYLDKNYKPDDVIEISSWYAYADNETSKTILEEYKKMYEAAESEGLELIISSGYRDYENQEETYNEYVRDYGEEYAKKYASLPGFSEHQTGLAFDILTFGTLTNEFEKTKEFEWLKNNSYKYGFILRYPKGKENITGYEYESWHYRYVGKEAAKQIHDEDITFDEYYAYYIERQ